MSVKERERKKERKPHEVQAGRDMRNRKHIICFEEKYRKIYNTNNPQFLEEIHGIAVSCKYTAGAQFSISFPESAGLEKGR